MPSDRVAEQDLGEQRRRQPPSPRKAPVAHYLAEQQRALLLGDRALRRSDQGAVHPTRVAARRLRSTLRSFRDGADADPGDRRLYEEVRWFAGLLGAVRDQQVQEERMLGLLDEVPAQLRVGPVATQISAELGQRRDSAWKELSDALRGERYMAMLELLAERVEDGTGPAAVPRAEPKTVVKAARRKARRRLRSAFKSNEPEQLHRARKAAKRARYAVEAAAPVLGPAKAERLVARYKDVQEVLGDYQDTVVGRELLRHLGADDASGQNGFTFGLIYEREAGRGERAVRAARTLVKHL